MNQKRPVRVIDFTFFHFSILTLDEFALCMNMKLYQMDFDCYVWRL